MNQERKNIFVVDNDAFMLQIYKISLSKKFNVQLCTNVEECNNKLREISADMFIIDLSLEEELDGLELIKIIRKLDDHTQTPIIVVTGYTSRHYEQHSFDAGATIFLRKPVMFVNLVDKINLLLSD